MSTRYKNPILKKNAPSLTHNFSIVNPKYQNVFKDNNQFSLAQLNNEGGLYDNDALDNMINEDDFQNMGLAAGGSGSIL